MTLLLHKVSLVLLLLQLYSYPGVFGQMTNCSSTTGGPRQCTPQDCEPGVTYFDSSLRTCEACTPCSTTQEVRNSCNRTHDTHCIPLCQRPYLFWNEAENNCVIDCSQCPGECDQVRSRCECGSCYDDTDLFCERNRCDISQSPPEATPPPSVGDDGRSHLPSWGIVLIAVGVVIGIVSFSACFLLMGLASSRRSTMDPTSASDGSESGLVYPSKGSLSTHSSYMSGSSAFFNNQSVLELLRNSQNGVHEGSLGSLHQSSPKGSRSSSKSPSGNAQRTKSVPTIV